MIRSTPSKRVGTPSQIAHRPHGRVEVQPLAQLHVDRGEALADRRRARPLERHAVVLDRVERLLRQDVAPAASAARPAWRSTHSSGAPGRGEDPLDRRRHLGADAVARDAHHRMCSHATSASGGLPRSARGQLKRMRRRAATRGPRSAAELPPVGARLLPRRGRQRFSRRRQCIAAVTPSPGRAAARTAWRRILPAAERGKSSTTVNRRGTLWPARRPRAWAASAGTSIPLAGTGRTQAATISPHSGSREAEDARLGDRGMALERLFDLARMNVLAAADDDVVGAADDHQPAVGVEVAEVAGRHPPSSRRAGRGSALGPETSMAPISPGAAAPPSRITRSPTPSSGRPSVAICDAASVMP